MTTPPDSSGDVRRVDGSPATASRYWAYVSHAPSDRRTARWLRRAIESYGVPAQLVSRATPSGEPAPRRFRPVSFGHATPTHPEPPLALAASRYLIVLCSPDAARSAEVDAEIRAFRALGRGQRVLALIVDGDPAPGAERDCFPPALREVEPLAADMRPEADGRRRAKLKLLAGMLGVSADELLLRQRQRRVARLAAGGALAATVAAIYGALIFSTYMAEQRRQLADSEAARGEAVAELERGRSEVARALEERARANAKEERDVAEQERLKAEGATLRADEEALRAKLAAQALEEERLRAQRERDRTLAAAAGESRARAEAESEGERATAQRLEAERQRLREAEQKLKADLAAATAEEARLKAEVEKGIALRAERTRRAVEYDADMRHAANLKRESETREFAELMAKYENPGDFDPRGFEWGYLRAAPTAGGKRVFELPKEHRIARQNGTARTLGRDGEAPHSDWSAVALSPDGTRVAGVAAKTGRGFLWRLDEPGEPIRFGPAIDVQFARGGRDLVVSSYTRVGDRAAFGELEALDATTGKRRLLLLERARLPLSFACDPNGDLVAVAGPEGLETWSLETGKRVKRLAGAGETHNPSWGHRAYQQFGLAVSVALHAKSGVAAIGRDTGGVDVWRYDVVEKKANDEDDDEEEPVFRRLPTRHAGPVLGLSFDREGKRLASLSAGAWSIHANQFQAGDVEVWDLASLSERARFPHSLWRIAEAPLYAPDVGESAVPPGRYRPLFSADGARLYMNGPKSLEILDPANGQPIGELAGHAGMVAAFDLSSDGRFAAGAGEDAALIVWPLGAPPADSGILAASDGRLGAIAFDPTGTTLCALASPPTPRAGAEKRASSPSLLAWRLEGGVATPIDPPLGSDAIAAGLRDARRAASPSGRETASGDDAGNVRLSRSDLRGKPRQFATHDGATLVVAYSPNGAVVVSGGADGRICVRDAETGELLASMPGHRREVASLAFSSDGRRMASGGGVASVGGGTAGEVIVWDAETWNPCLTLELEESATFDGVCFAPDGTTLYATANPLGDDARAALVAWRGGP